MYLPFLVLKFFTGAVFLSIAFAILVFYLAVLLISNRRPKKKVMVYLKPWLILFGVLIIFILSSHLFLFSWSTFSKNACESKGGIWEENSVDNSPFRYDQPYNCNVPKIDAGKVCSDSSECESFCMPVGTVEIGASSSGICYKWSKWPNFGCIPILKQGKVTMGQGCSF